MASADAGATDLKKRAFDALERRFAVTKLQQQPQQQQKKNANDKRRCVEEEKRKEKAIGEVGKAPLNPPTPDISATKGRFSFVGGTSKTSDEEAAYRELSLSVDSNLIRPIVQPTGGVSTVNKILHDLLRNGDFSQKYMQGSKNTKIENYFLLDNLVSNQIASAKAREKALKSHSKRSKKHMSMKQHKKYGSLDLPQEFHKFSIYKPMHEMWKGYIVKVLKETGKSQIPQRLLTADLHGALFLVVDCKMTGYTGINGIMIRETAKTFGIVTEDNKFRVVPKMGSVFIFQAGNWKITLHGDKLSMRERVS